MLNTDVPGAVAPADFAAVLAGAAHPALLVAQTLLGDLTHDLFASIIIDDRSHTEVRALLARNPDLINEAAGAVAVKYEMWREHPRLGQEALINEVRAADASFNRAVVGVLNVSPGDGGEVSAAARFAQFKLLAASIRVIAIFKVVGFDRAMAAQPKSVTKAGRRSKKSSNPRGGHPIGLQHLSEKVGLRVTAFDEAIGTAREAVALGDLDVLRGTREDKDAVVTKLMVTGHRAPERISALAKSLGQAKENRVTSPSTRTDVPKERVAQPAAVVTERDAELQKFIAWLSKNGTHIAHLLEQNGAEVSFGTEPSAPHVKAWAARFVSDPEVQTILRALYSEFHRNKSDVTAFDRSN